MKTHHAIALVAVAPAFGASLVLGLATAHAEPIQEDSPNWSCVDDGNRICGPNNAEGQPAGCYDDGGVLVAAWPCYVVIDPQTGDSDVYTPGDPPNYPTDVY